MSRISVHEDMHFATVHWDAKSKQSIIKAVHRWRTDDQGVFRMEMYDPRSGMWVPNPNLIAATGIGGDNNYEVISKEKAEGFIEVVSNAKQD